MFYSLEKKALVTPPVRPPISENGCLLFLSLILLSQLQVETMPALASGDGCEAIYNKTAKSAWSSSLYVVLCRRHSLGLENIKMKRGIVLIPSS